jgi:hypothetical protein
MRVVNKSNRSLAYGSGAAAGVLPVGGHLTLTFQVNTIGTLNKPNGTPYWTVMQGSLSRVVHRERRRQPGQRRQRSAQIDVS